MRIITDSLSEELVLPLAILQNQILVQDKSRMSVFDCFDRFDPEYLILSSQSINKAYIKNISERPHLKVVIINNEPSNLEEVKAVLGNSFLEISDEEYYNPIKFKNVEYSPKFSTDLVCINAEEILDIEKYYPSKYIIYRIFSNKKIINHNNYCGILKTELEPVTIKSSKMSIVTKKNRLNSIYAGSVPILNPSDVELYLEKDLSETLESMKRDLFGKSNFELLANIFSNIQENETANRILEIGRNFL